MAVKIKKVRLDSVENQAITGLIVSDSYLKRIRNKLRREHLKTPYGGTVLQWCFDYFDTYGKAPGLDVRRIYREEKEKLHSKEEGRLLGIYLEKLSEDYENQSKFNPDYIYDQTLDYIRRRDLENLVEGIRSDLDRGRDGKASKRLVDFQLIHKETSKIFNPLDEKYIEEHFDEKEEGILYLPGALGELVGPLDRAWLVSFTAPEKRGKTWWLVEMAFQALSQKLKVLFVSLEMSEKDIRQRIWKRAGASAKRSRAVIPVLDCKLNQKDECENFNIRENEVKLYDEEDEKPAFREARKYKPCGEYLRCPNFRADFWYESVRVNKWTKENLIDKTRDIRKVAGDSLRIKCFPAYTANMLDIRSLIEELEVNEGFVPDVLITDYLDILATMPGVEEGRTNIDVTWKMGKSIAVSKSLLHLTVDQSSKITYEKDIRLYDTAEDKRKNAHLDVKVAMNAVQDKMEEHTNALRFSVIAHRHRYFKPYKQVLVLQQTEIGQPLIDCTWYRRG